MGPDGLEYSKFSRGNSVYSVLSRGLNTFVFTQHPFETDNIIALKFQMRQLRPKGGQGTCSLVWKGNSGTGVQTLVVGGSASRYLNVTLQSSGTARLLVGKLIFQ